MSAVGPSAPGRPPLLAALVGSLLAMVAVDFLLHAALLSHWWRATAAFWRPPDELFAYIPYAYGSFVLYAAGLDWLLIRLRGPRPLLRDAALGGLVTGAVIGGAGILATYSVVPLPRSALVVFTISLSFVMSSGAVAAAWVLTAPRPWRRVALLTAAALALLVLGVILQNVLFPTPPGQRRPASITQAPVRPAPTGVAS
jgi:hypothetical protein